MRNEWSPWAHQIMSARYAHDVVDVPKHDGDTGCYRKESWPELARRVTRHVFGAIKDQNLVAPYAPRVQKLIEDRVFIPGGRYLYAAGREFHQVQNCLLLRAEDTREGWADHLSKVALASMTGAGVGAVYSDLREKGAPIRRTGGKSSGPLALMQATNEVGRAAEQGGNRRAALWAGLHWDHPDVHEFIRMKHWPEEVRALKAVDHRFPATMDYTNISVIFDDAFFEAYARHSLRAYKVFWETLASAVQYGDPGFSIDIGSHAGENLRNACTEVTSKDDSDICNLGSINLARIESPAHMRQVVESACAFLLAGTVYSDVPYDRVRGVRARNRRLGLGLMGIAEWQLQRGERYGTVSDDLTALLKAYARSGVVATRIATDWMLSAPLATRSIAPTGTIGIVAETTTGMEPIFAVAYQRRYIEQGARLHQYVVDPVAKRLLDSGVPADAIEDAYALASTPEGIERRLDFQVYLQQYVDHAVSSTINLAPWGSPSNNDHTVKRLGEALLSRMPALRGITFYPDGARGGQPLTRVSLEQALGKEGQVFEAADVCSIRGGTDGASCGE